MTIPITVAAVQAPSAALPQVAAQAANQSSPANDVERLRALVAGTAAPQGTYVEANAPATTATGVAASEKSSFQTLGDSILSGIANFNTGYNQSLDSIEVKLDKIASGDALEMGNNFHDIMGLQVEIARWSMSVMGVDNASKAGTNTVKELSKGA